MNFAKINVLKKLYIWIWWILVIFCFQSYYAVLNSFLSIWRYFSQQIQIPIDAILWQFAVILTFIYSTLQELCPDYTKDQLKMLDDVAFWLDGVAKSMTALLGIFSNILAAYVLNRPKMKNSFNLCLVALACIDTIYLFLQFLESLRKR